MHKCQDPHKHWVFRSLAHFHFSSRPWPDWTSHGPGPRWAPFRTDRGGSRDRSPCLPKRQQKWGDGCPPLGVPPRPGVLLEEGAGRVAQSPLPGLSAAQRAPRSLHFFHRLRRVKVKAARRCLALCKPLKRLERNFSLSLPHPSATPYTMRNRGWSNSTTWPLPTQISATVPSTSAGISFISFIASIMHRVSPFFTWSPTSTKGRASGLGAE